MELPFLDRHDAGRRLAGLLGRFAGDPAVIVLGLPRGGVVVAAEVAAALSAPLDAFVVRKLGVPGFEELAFGAIASGGGMVLNQDVIRDADLSREVMDLVIAKETEEIDRRVALYNAGRAPTRGRTVLLVDDGLATGATMRAGVRALRQSRPSYVVAAAPVGAAEVVESLGREADEVVCVATPAPFGGVGRWYKDFAQTTDAQVRALLERAHAGQAH